jgi:hypothetical protein
VITQHACVHIMGVNVKLKGFSMDGDLESFNDIFFLFYFDEELDCVPLC